MSSIIFDNKKEKQLLNYSKQKDPPLHLIIKNELSYGGSKFFINYKIFIESIYELNVKFK
jgi:hypothetical protein